VGTSTAIALQLTQWVLVGALRTSRGASEYKPVALFHLKYVPDAIEVTHAELPSGHPDGEASEDPSQAQCQVIDPSFSSLDKDFTCPERASLASFPQDAAPRIFEDVVKKSVIQRDRVDGLRSQLGAKN